MHENSKLLEQSAVTTNIATFVANRIWLILIASALGHLGARH